MEQGAFELSRRSALRGLVLAPVALTVTGCSIRLEEDAPDLPVLTTQGPLPDEDLLLASLRSVQKVLRLAEQTPLEANPWIDPVRTAHRAQITRLVEVMAGLGIDVPSAAGSLNPSPTPTGTSAPTGTQTSGQSSTASGTSGTPSASSSPTSGSTAAGVARLAASEGDFPTSADESEAWSAQATNRPMVVALCAARRAAQQVLGGSAPPHRGAPPTGDAARVLARAIRPAVHGFEQIAARTALDRRDQVIDTLKWLEGARNELAPVAGERERTSYVLPHRVTDEESARRLARALLGDVLTAMASQVDPISEQKTDARQWAMRVWSATAADRARWGGQLAAFPGMRS